MSFPPSSLLDLPERYAGGEIPVSGSKLLVIVFVMGMSGSEALLYMSVPLYAMWGYLGTIVVTTLGGARIGGDGQQLSILAILPAFRLINLEMPVFFDFWLYQTVLVYAVFIPAFFYAVDNHTHVFHGKASPYEELSRGGVVLSKIPGSGHLVRLGAVLQLKSALLWLVPGGLLALALAELEFGIRTPETFVQAGTEASLLVTFVVSMAIIGLVEEFLFRGLVQRILQVTLGRWAGLLLASGLYGIMHIGYGLPAEFLFGGFTGFLLGLFYDRTNSFALVTFIHTLQNVLLLGVLPVEGPIISTLFG